MPKVTVYTQVYNAKKYIEQCVSSVLNQTLTDFEYLLVDSASTDGSGEILDAYASKDPRVRVIHLAENRLWVSGDILSQYATGEYCTVLDHDDWLESDFLESLLAFAEKNHLDVACTGTRMHIEKTGQQSLRRLPEPLIVDRPQYPDWYPWYHQFFRTRWNKLVRMEHALRAHDKNLPPLPLYGGDTILCFRILRYTKRIGIDNTILHHYRIHGASQSYQYDPTRIEADAYCYQDAMDFLSAFGPVSEKNKLFAQCVYANAVQDTVKMISSSSLTAKEKLEEYRKIAGQPAARDAYWQPQRAADLKNSKNALWSAVLDQARKGAPDSAVNMGRIAEELSPNCAAAAAVGSAGLFIQASELKHALLDDDRDALADELLHFLSEGRYIKQYNILKVFHAALPEGSPLSIVESSRFFGKYRDISYQILKENYLTALDGMTDFLLSGKKIYERETFLQLYLLLAALEEQAPAFLFGKIRLAQMYQQERRTEECQAVISELEEMGAGGHEEVEALRRRIEQ